MAPTLRRSVESLLSRVRAGRCGRRRERTRGDSGLAPWFERRGVLPTLCDSSSRDDLGVAPEGHRANTGSAYEKLVRNSQVSGAHFTVLGNLNSLTRVREVYRERSLDSSVFDPKSLVSGLGTRNTRQPVAVARRPSHASFYVVLLACGLGFGFVLGLPLVDGSFSEYHLSGGLAMFLGSFTGMAGTYLALIMVVLASRMPALERVLGQNGVIHWHRRLAPWPIVLIAAHAVLLTLAYAESAKTGVLHEAGAIVNTFPHMLTATIALGIMVGIGLISIRQIRVRIPRENWWLIHLLMYVALVLAFAHELVLGPSFVKHPFAQVSWIAAWSLAAATVLVYRVGFPVYRSLRHRLRVAEVKPEGPGVVSIILEGRQLDRLVIAGGQFFEWRFMTRGMWWQAHPFTVSALPQAPYLRLTVQGAGDFTRALAQVKVGTSVGIEGPYGAFTVFAGKANRVLLIAGGVGVTAARSLLEDLPVKSRPVVVLRARTDDDLLLDDEVEELVRHRKGTLHRLIGSRQVVPLNSIVKLVPDMAKRDVFISGSESFVRDAVAMALRAGVPSHALHQEAYSI